MPVNIESRRVSQPVGAAGFTLLEMLASVAIMAFIVGALATITGQWIPGWKQGVFKAQNIQLVSVGIQRLASDISAAQFVSVGPDWRFPLFEGAESSVMFIRTTSGPNANVGLEVVRFSETRDRLGQYVLVRATAPYNPRTDNRIDEFTFSNQITILHAPYKVSFAFSGDDWQWKDSWSGSSGLPRFVQLRIRDSLTRRELALSTTTRIRSGAASALPSKH